MEPENVTTVDASDERVDKLDDVSVGGVYDTDSDESFCAGRPTDTVTERPAPTPGALVHSMDTSEVAMVQPVAAYDPY